MKRALNHLGFAAGTTLLALFAAMGIITPLESSELPKGKAPAGSSLKDNDNVSLTAIVTFLSQHKSSDHLLCGLELNENTDAFKQSATTPVLLRTPKSYKDVLIDSLSRKKPLEVSGVYRVLTSEEVRPLHRRVFLDGGLSDLTKAELSIWQEYLNIANAYQSALAQKGLLEPGMFSELRFGEIRYIDAKKISALR